ncbi:hypothetical protein [Caballeronia sp. Lep1P3]|uniref:hypothetical protein n=1 Tax=Caballeronia sp. Lep1P3 TaxID=2878150 RepID=UPI001FD3F9A6|nr:hypothetical protein [Caballeronia sp. Lep1P3]
MTTSHTYGAYSEQTGEANAIAAATGIASIDEPRPAAARAASEQRFRTALACLGAAYALSWAELALALAMGFPGDAASHPIAASIVSRVLVGLLYLCVASRLQWARWLTVVLGFATVLLVAPTLALQWHVFPAAAAVSGLALACRLAASLYLLSPMPRRQAR